MEEPGQLKRALIDATAGAISGGISRTVTSPLDAIKIRFQVYPNIRSALIDIIKTRGFQGLYAGLSPALVEIIPYALLQFGTYDTFKRWAEAWNWFRSSNINVADGSPSSFQLFIFGLAASTCAKVVCHPLDVVKKRFQIEGL
ncbi:mitochondrial thiamine diphosphate carrier 2-like isoform X2 [Actinidia eriantha]|uniref:mitochondrial thiamine diphosphate carrier 2-like isoform X2 n=1 Tax=Actinidia eriantha TaxID=165200 RepID=UPI0025831741|nr:mitochondrial thiamine diphosphate carrier 2-like isoform X2 [Actinidia eriantha]